MSKFSSQFVPPRVHSPVQTTGQPHRTFEGGQGYTRDAKSELFLLAVTNMVSEATFYESAKDRDNRFRDLVAAVTQEDPAWITRFIPYLRTTMNMRSAAIVMACEYVKAGGPNGALAINVACSRPDEPAEVLAYWAQMYGKKFPQPIKRGVAGAVRKLYSERAALKYDGQSRAWRMGDVIDLVHPRPRTAGQSALFRYLLDSRHNRGSVDISKLPMITENIALHGVPVEERRAILSDPDRLARAGMTWEALSGWLQGPMDREAWSAIIPSMGYMALLRNLRNFDQAGVDGNLRIGVQAILSNPAEVKKSRQFPYRFWSAYKANSPSSYDTYLDQALDLSTSNIPEFKGHTLVLIDMSGSMTAPLSSRTKIMRWEVGALFGAAVAKRNPNQVGIGLFGTSWGYFEPYAMASTLTAVQGIGEVRATGRLGWGTNAYPALTAMYNKQDRVCIFTDEQVHPYEGIHVHVADSVPRIYVFNLGGYRTGMSDRPNVHTVGGFTDSAFRMIELLERGKDADWPF